MRDIFNYIKQLPSAYWGSYAYQGFFYASLIIILIFEKDKIKKHMYATYALILLLIVMNPITIQISKLFFGEGGVAAYYPRMFAMMPLICIIAYAFVLLVDKTTGFKKLCLVAIMSAMVVMGGNCIYTEAWMQKADNQAKIPDAVVEICSYVHSDEDIVKIAVPSDIVCYIRQWDASLLMPYGRNMNEWGKLLDEATPAAKKVLAEAANVDCDYIVTHRTDAWWSDFYALGYEPEYIMDDYMIYHVEGVEGYRYTYNDLMQVSCKTRVSSSGQPIATSSGYCSISYEYDLKGRKLREMYFDTEDEPYAVSGGYYGISYSYNRKNLVAKLTYLDKEGSPVQRAEGYAGICYSYNSDNKNIYEYYVDKEGNSVATIGGYYGIKRCYDDKGYVSSLTYVDDNGDAVIYGSYGVATIIYEYNDAGQNMYERYFDQNGIPIAKANGAYGTKMEYNPDGRVRQYTYVDEKGTSIIISNGYSSITYEYDEKGRNIDERYFDIDGSPIALSYGQYGMKREYNEDGLVSKLAYTDAEGNPMLASTGYAEISYEYNDLKQVIKENYFDIDGNPIAVSNGSYGVLKEYDEVGFISRCTYIDAEGKPMNVSSGYTILETDRNEKGQNIYERYFDEQGAPFKTATGYCGIKREYTDAGKVSKLTYVDASGDAVNITSGYATITYEYNDAGEEIDRHYYDKDGKELEVDSLARERISSGYKDDYWVLTNYKDASGN